LNEVAKSSVVLDRELEEGKSLSPPIRASAARTAAGRIANKTMVLHLRARVEHVRYGRRLPNMPPSMD